LSASELSERLWIAKTVPVAAAARPTPPMTSAATRCPLMPPPSDLGTSASTGAAWAGPVSTAGRSMGTSVSAGTVTVKVRAAAGTSISSDQVCLPGALTRTTCLPGSTGTPVPHEALRTS
jgi:hypothetical protein